MPLRHFAAELSLSDVASIGGFAMRGAAEEDFAGFNFGSSDINADGLSDLIVCADGYDGGGYLAGGAFVIYGKRDGITPVIDFANMSPADGFVIQGEFAFDLASRSISGAGDINGDGIEDMLIGAFKNDEGAHDSGAAYIIYGRSTPFDSVIDLYDLSPDVGIKIVGEGAEDYASFWVSSAGDVNGDGRNDLIMGAPLNDAGGTDAGAAYVIFGRETNFPGKISLANLNPAVGFKITGAGAGYTTGYGVGSTDINGDGISDLIVGAPQDGTAAPGQAYVLYGRSDISEPDLSLLSPEKGFVIRGEANGDMTGFNVAGAGDVNGDGIADLLIGATRNDGGGSDAGAAYVVFGSRSGFAPTLDLSSLDGDVGFKIQGAAAGDETGVCVAAAGDVNGDGYADVLVGAQFSSITGTISGVAYLLFGKPGGFAATLDLAVLSPRDGIRIRGDSAGDTTGRAVSSAGDMNGDGYADIAIGSPWDDPAGFKSGTAYVIYGRPDNQAPVARDSQVSVSEDHSYVFTGADFGMSDSDGDALLGIEIATLPSRGTMLLLGDAGSPDRSVAAGDWVTAEALALGRLIFVPEPNASGGAYASLSFRVRDDGGIVANGEDTSATTATLTIAVAADTSDSDIVYGTPGDDLLSAERPDATLVGLGGDDTYLVTSAEQRVAEEAGEGDDVIRTTVNYALATGSHVESLEAADPAATTYLQLTGNAFANHLIGNAGVNSLNGNGGGDVLEGLDGDDSYLVSTSADRIVEAAGGGFDTVYALGNYVLTQGAAVEVLLAYDRSVNLAQDLTGNEFDNLILGTNGVNVLTGGGGHDTMYGYGGDDTYFVDSADDFIVELYGEGNDTIVTSTSYVMPQGMEFEIMRTIDPTATTTINLTGNKIPNIIFGNSGNNLIDGGGGGDTMQGLEGDDTYIVRDSTDRVLDGVGGGTDTVRTLVDYSLSSGAYVEALEAYDPLATTTLRLTGNGADNVINGNAGVNVLNGGAGLDVLRGLGGDDSYIVEDSRTRIEEAVGGGRDTVYVQVNYALAPVAEIETMSVLDRGTVSPLRLTGNAFSNLIYGNAGNNVLDGGGGADTLYGLAGDDTYFVDSADDPVIDAAGFGFDTVFTTSSYTLDRHAEIEVLAATDASSIVSLRLTGNAFNNTIKGGAGNDSIDGGGGADALYGRAGDDSYLVQDGRATVTETAGEGRDTVYVTIDYRLAAGSEIEVFTAYERETLFALNLAGNEVANTIYGNAGANRIEGGGGNDVLYGLGGADTFVFADRPSSDNVDQIVDFVSGVDKLELDRAVFDSLAAGVLDAAHLAVGAQAADADDRIIYDPATGAVSYDPDGSGGAEAIRFALLAPQTLLTASDITIV